MAVELVAMRSGWFMNGKVSKLVLVKNKKLFTFLFFTSFLFWRISLGSVSKSWI